MAKRKTVAVLGLGLVGSTLAKELRKYNCDVVAIDKDLANVERVSPYVANAICLDFSNKDLLEEMGIGDADVGIITNSDSLEASVMGVINLKELGVPYVIAKAKNKRFADVLKKVGADEVVSPEKEYAKSLAKRLVSRDVLELFDVDDNYSIFDTKLPDAWVGKSLVELNLRSRFNLNVIGVRRAGSLIINFGPNEKFDEGDEVLMVGENEIFKKFESLYK